MISTDYLRFVLSLAVVLGLIMLCAWLVRRFRLGSCAETPVNSGRLKLVERLVINPQQHLVIIKQDDQEHLLLLGPETGVLIERAIKVSLDDRSDLPAAAIGLSR